MEENIFMLVAEQGAWAILSVVLILYILKKQEDRDLKQDEREKNYQELLRELSSKFEIINLIQADVEEIKDGLKKISI